jgi:hypothetical protein
VLASVLILGVAGGMALLLRMVCYGTATIMTRHAGVFAVEEGGQSEMRTIRLCSLVKLRTLLS